MLKEDTAAVERGKKVVEAIGHYQLDDTKNITGENGRQCIVEMIDMLRLPASGSLSLGAIKWALATHTGCKDQTTKYFLRI